MHFWMSLFIPFNFFKFLFVRLFFRKSDLLYRLLSRGIPLTVTIDNSINSSLKKCNFVSMCKVQSSLVSSKHRPFTIFLLGHSHLHACKLHGSRKADGAPVPHPFPSQVKKRQRKGSAKSKSIHIVSKHFIMANFKHIPKWKIKCKELHVPFKLLQ